jgi:hypothetical protein
MDLTVTTRSSRSDARQRSRKPPQGKYGSFLVLGVQPAANINLLPTRDVPTNYDALSCFTGPLSAWYTSNTKINSAGKSCTAEKAFLIGSQMPLKEVVDRCKLHKIGGMGFRAPEDLMLV